MTMQERLRIHSEIEAADKAHRDRFEHDTAVSELTITIRKINAIATAFAHEFTEGTPDANTLAVRTAPDRYVHLFAALTDELYEALTIADRLDA